MPIMWPSLAEPAAITEPLQIAIPSDELAVLWPSYLLALLLAGERHGMSTVRSADGTVIDYDRYGAGPAVVFINGAGVYRATDPGTGQAARLLAAEGFTAVDYDRRGRGRSADTQPWSIDREVEDVAAIAENVGGTAALCSNSSGADVALAAASGTGLVTALVLYEPPFFAGLNLTGQLSELRALLAQGKNDEAMRYNLTSVIGLPASRVDEMALAPAWAAMVAAAPTLVYDHGATHEICTDPDWRRRWAGIAMPALVCSGDRTFPGLPAAADAVAAALPNASRRILPGQGHRPAAEALVPVLAEFLRPS
jgi:pimeloyl-ACP methyl ester carboxylesterase